MTEALSLTYGQLKRFVLTAAPYAFDLTGIREDEHPLALMEKLERRSKKLAMKSMRMAVIDLLSAMANDPAAKLEALSRDLAAANAPSLIVVRAWASNRMGAILARGYIRTSEEFEQIGALLDGPDIDDGEQERLQRMLDRYEFDS